jgi:RNA polymerase II subunit A-like phosphatase
MSELYELHVYTAGSRTYANAVCKGLDPDGRYFGDRILSRDESGSEYLVGPVGQMIHCGLTFYYLPTLGAAQKTLKRLFPADQSMVVVIDDRYEVWNHAANLVKVVPCESSQERVSKNPEHTSSDDGIHPPR